jgi:hypothetical protein
MQNSFKRLAATLSVCVALTTSPALAQTVNSQEGAQYYANVRGWSVYQMSDGRGIFACRAVRGNGYNDQIMIEYNAFEGGNGEWAILVQGRRTEFDGPDARGAGAHYDGTFVDRQIYFGFPGMDGDSNSHARLGIEAYELGLLKKSSNFTLDINRETRRAWSLAGSTAAILKVAECADRMLGTSLTAKPRAAPRAAPTPAPTQRQPVQPQVARVDGFSVGTVRFPQGDFRKVFKGSWEEQGDNGSVFFFREFDRNADSVFLEDQSRNVQIWIDLHSYEIRYTQNHDYNRWETLYQIECYGEINSRQC